MFNNNPFISVIMCVYNTPQDFLNAAVLSILNQTYTNFELLIVDDCSDKDLYANSLFKDPKIRILKNKSNMGPAYSRNRALEVASGEYLAIMDSDDISFPNRLKQQLSFLDKNPNLVACGTWFQFFGEKNHCVKRIIPERDYFRCCLFFDNAPTLLNPSMMIKKNVLIDNDIKWNEQLRIGEDYLMWIQLLEVGEISNVDEVLIKYRVHKSQTTNKNNVIKHNSNTCIIQEYQLKKLRLKMSENEIVKIRLKKINNKKELIDIDNLLIRVLKANEASKYFEQKALKLRCDEQINILIRSVHNPLTFISLLLSRRFGKKTLSIFGLKIKKIFAFKCKQSS